MIKKSKGGTSTEQALAQLCENTFLKFWSYPNPHKDDKKELCDLIAVFDEHVFIFFVREKKLNATNKNLLVKWKRWKRGVIDKQIKSLGGAERYIKTGKPIFVDSKCETRLPVVIPENPRIHKFVVAHGAEETVKKFSSTDYSGGLAISYKKRTDFSGERPFCIELDKDDPVHILDDSNVQIILSELDTIYDFTEYINEKERNIHARPSILYFGEHELLGQYFLGHDEGTNKYRLGPEDSNDPSVSDYGFWKYVIELDEYKRRKEANKTFHLWDNLIQHAYQDALDGVLLGEVDLGKGRNPVHEMAKEPRFFRRTLSEKIEEVILNFPETDDEILYKTRFLSSFQRDKGYVFLQLKSPQTGDFENRYRPDRQRMLKIACGVCKNKYSHLNTIVGIAEYATKYSKGNSRDFMLKDCSEWTEEQRKYYEPFENKNAKETMRYITDFPQEEG